MAIETNKGSPNDSLGDAGYLAEKYRQQYAAGDRGTGKHDGGTGKRDGGTGKRGGGTGKRSGGTGKRY
jgi:hypothetical protein